MRTHLVCLSMLLAGLTMSSSGCIVLAAGVGAAGTMAYAKGDLEAEEHQNIDQVYTAARKAAEDLGLHVIRGEGGRDALSATLVARDAGDKRVTVKLKTVAQDVTKLSIRVGTFGDDTKQRLIYNSIRENLKATCPQLAQASPATLPGPPAQVPPNAPTENPPSPPSSQEPSQSPPDPSASQPPAQDPPHPPAPQ